ncbi:MAG: selenocysteine-specific translation elongation factor [Acidobacteriota bacterium]|nr:selenocysteine-specific translation elongation factor [Acidobacteriota bacterium]MDQ3420217.1 selenocysteine-specific translation elongation factor [Acidobacteriota bacterium]
MPHIIVGTAGHIDHGKTALVKALTGTDTDRLKEEKERGITIDLGFASLALDARTTLGFVDVPGHERFIKNMLAGVGGIDVVLLVISAEESVMPQTREHLAICSLLRVQRGLTVLTKIDAVEPGMADLVEIDVQEFLKGSFLEDAPIVRVSARSGEGIPGLIDALRGMADTVPPRDAQQMLRLPVDRTFTMKGFGPVAAGTLIAGSVRRDDEVELMPGRKAARVRGVQVHGVSVDEARAGQRTALNLQRVDLEDIERGMVVTPPGVFSPTSTIDVAFELLASAPHPLPSRKRIRFHVGTTELIGHLVLLGQDTLEPGATSFARIRLERPAFALPGDRFIVRQYSPMTTIGGGEILDAAPPRRRRSDPSLVTRLRVFRDGSPAERILQLVSEAGASGFEVGQLVTRLGLMPSAAREALDGLVKSGRGRIIADAPFTVASAEAFDALATEAAATVRAFHKKEPLVKGIGREELKARVFPTASAAFFRAVLDDLGSRQVLVVDQDVVHAHGRTMTLEGADEKLRTQLADRFRELGLQVPSPDEVAAGAGVDRTAARKIIQLLVKERTLVKVNDSMVVDGAALDKLVADVRARKAFSAKLDVATFKELTGLSRKFAVPLLEYLDGQRVTRRVGDGRVIL